MTKFIAGLLIGFFLATGIMAGMVQVYMGPHYQTVKTAQPYAEGAYNIAHGSGYFEMQSLAYKINDAATAISQLPLIGSAIEKEKVTEYTRFAIDTLKNAKDSSEVMLSLVNMTISLIEMSIPLLALSVIMIGAGCYIYQKETDAAPEAKKGRKK